jgi:hypothetical protein
VTLFQEQFLSDVKFGNTEVQGRENGVIVYEWNITAVSLYFG